MPQQLKMYLQQPIASNSQQSYERLIGHFANLIQVLVQNTLYAPNEVELQVTPLQSKLAELQNKNTSLINSFTI